MKNVKNVMSGKVNSARFGSKDAEILKKGTTRDYVEYESPFYATKRMYQNYISHYTLPLSYDEWVILPEDYKVAVLYVQFFDQISLAWHKLYTEAAIEAECDSEVQMYLYKNVPIIAKDRKRFTPAYIYKICYNCIYCKSIDPYKGQTAATSWFNNTTSCYKKDDSGDEINLFDLRPESDDTMDDILDREHFWNLIESMGDDVQSVVEKLLKGNQIRGKSNVEILERLKTVLAPYKELYYN